MNSRLQCTGCAACAVVCDHNAISMKEDREGFLFPEINSSLCTKCGACDAVCKLDVPRCIPIVTKCFQVNDNKTISKSTSGGAIPAIATGVLKKGGCVAAVEYDSVSQGGKWVIIEELSEIQKIQGSKYFQIPVPVEIVNKVKKRCDKQMVLFVGTPCQVECIKKCIHSSSLFTIDLICGGVASYKLEKAYIQYWEKKEKKKVNRHFFRAKPKGWTREYVGRVEFNDGSTIDKIGYDDLFNRAINSGNCYRESCYNCRFNTMRRVGDFTVGDAWGIERQQEWFDQLVIRNGVSLVLINNNKAKKLFDDLYDCSSIDAPMQVLDENRPLHANIKRKKLRSVAYYFIEKFDLNVSANFVNYRYLIKSKILRKQK